MEAVKEGDAIGDLAEQILESYDLASVVIIATKSDKNGTNSYHGKAGNWFAIYGSVSDFLLRCDTQTQNSIE